MRSWKKKNKEKDDRYTTAWRKRNPEKVKEQKKRYYKKNSDQIKAISKKYRIDNKGKMNMSKNRYNKEHMELLIGRPKPTHCELCGRGGKICADHDHQTGKYRGWLCSNCNCSLGLMDENSEFIHRLIDYLEKHKTSTA